METVQTSRIPTIAPIRFVKESAAELRKVTWPTRAETVKLTVIVIALSVIVGLFIGGTDLLFLKLSTLLYK